MSYAAEVRRTRLRVNLVDPGPMRTRLRARAYPGEDPARQPPPETAIEPFHTLAAPDCARHGELIRAQADR
jgi:NAD(P)-dependent dehydrogenase (short-subunit alcohol dehydrogenase family)